MKNTDTPVKLYACLRCSRQVFEDQMASDAPTCRRCGGMKYRYMQPTFFARLAYLVHTFGIIRGLAAVFTWNVLPAPPEPKMKIPQELGYRLLTK